MVHDLVIRNAGIGFWQRDQRAHIAAVVANKRTPPRTHSIKRSEEATHSGITDFDQEDFGPDRSSGQAQCLLKVIVLEGTDHLSYF
jgi:hypothetical protein